MENLCQSVKLIKRIATAHVHMKTEDSVNKQKWIYLLPLFYGQCEDSVWVLALLDLQKSYCFPGGTSGKEPACQCRRPKRVGLILGSGRSPGEGNGNPFQYGRIPWTDEPGRLQVHRVAKSWTQLKRLSTHTK